MNLFKQTRYLIISVAVLTGAAFMGGVYAGHANYSPIDSLFSLSGKQALASTTSADFAPFWKVWDVINEKYVTPNKVTDQEKVWGAISGLAKSLGDPYTVFMPPEEAKSFETEISGNFEGVGMEVGIRDEMLTVIAPLKGNPAEKAGIKAGDKIIKIDDTVASDLSVDKAVLLIRGPKGTAVTLTLIREGKSGSFEVKVMRDVITIPTIDKELRKDGIYVIQLYNFSAVSPNLFNKAISDFVKTKSNKLILDLRGNPGGYLDASVDMASWFVPKGKVIVREDFGGKQEENIYRSDGRYTFGNTFKMIVLVDEGSASASEILAGALQEHGIAKLVGTKTFGKGSVQELVKITPDTNLKITIAKWLTPNGKSISEGGLTPDYEVKMSEDDIKADKDLQMDKAVELLK
ncbi:MAG: S41 family peptidase [Candidatus Taylorbacteria bacterium]